MKLKLFVYVLFSTVPGLLARSTGAPPQACNDMMPRHGVNSQPTNNGYFIISDAVNSYSPGEDYLGTKYSIANLARASIGAALAACTSGLAVNTLQINV